MQGVSSRFIFRNGKRASNNNSVRTMLLYLFFLWEGTFDMLEARRNVHEKVQNIACG